MRNPTAFLGYHFAMASNTHSFFGPVDEEIVSMQRIYPFPLMDGFFSCAQIP